LIRYQHVARQRRVRCRNQHRYRQNRPYLHCASPFL
jgi:hypothetical protein